MKQERFPIKVKRGSVTVRIYRDVRPAGTYYRVTYYLGGKQRRMVFSDLDKAKREAEARACQLARGDIDAAQVTGQDRLIYGRALEIVSPFGLSLDGVALDYAEARKALGEIPLKEAIQFFLTHNAGVVSRISIQDAVAEFIGEKRSQGLSKVYLDDLRLRLRGFQNAFQDDLNRLSRDDIRKWLASLKTSPRSFNNLHKTLKTFLGYAQSRKWMPKGIDLLEGVAKRKVEETRAAIRELGLDGDVKA